MYIYVLKKQNIVILSMVLIVIIFQVLMKQINTVQITCILKNIEIQLFLYVNGYLLFFINNILIIV